MRNKFANFTYRMSQVNWQDRIPGLEQSEESHTKTYDWGNLNSSLESIDCLYFTYCLRKMSNSIVRLERVWIWRWDWTYWILFLNKFMSNIKDCGQILVFLYFWEPLFTTPTCSSLFSVGNFKFNRPWFHRSQLNSFRNRNSLQNEIACDVCSASAPGVTFMSLVAARVDHTPEKIMLLLLLLNRYPVSKCCKTNYAIITG